MQRPQETEPTFGEYVLHEQLGRGGMAETFIASRRMAFGTEPRVCLKRILPGLCDEPALRSMFFVEAKLSAQLHHGNIVRVVDFGEVEDTAFLTLELVHGTDLRRVLSIAARTTPLEASVITELAFTLGCALDFAHAVSEEGTFQGLVHRDVSPSNVLLAMTGDVKLADFGIAKAVGQTVLTRTGALKGKIPYMPPEYALEGKYDARSDLFSLGVTLYECCALRRPFHGANDVATLEQITSGRFVTLESRADLDLPIALRRAVDRLLAFHPKDRFPDAGAFVDAIADVADVTSGRTLLAARVRDASERIAARAAAKAARATESVSVPTALEARGGPVPEDEAVVPAAADDATRTRLPR